MVDVLENRSKFVYEAARIAAIASNAPIVPVPWGEREEPFRAQFRKVIERQSVMKATEPRWFDIREQVPSIGQLCVVASAESIFGLAQWGTLEPVLVRDWVYPWAPNYTCIFDPSAVFWFPLPPLPNVVIWQGKVSAVVH